MATEFPHQIERDQLVHFGQRPAARAGRSALLYQCRAMGGLRDGHSTRCRARRGEDSTDRSSSGCYENRRPRMECPWSGDRIRARFISNLKPGVDP